MYGGNVGHFRGQERVHAVDQMLQIRTGQLFGLNRFLDSKLGTVRLWIVPVQSCIVIATVQLVVAAQSAVHCRTSVQMTAIERTRRHRSMIGGTPILIRYAVHAAAQAAVVVTLVAERCRCVQRPLDDRRPDRLVHDRLKA